jgi:hypothetical protein
MGLPDMTPGMNTAIDTPPDFFSGLAPPLKGRTIQKTEMTKNKRLFINASLRKFAGAKKTKSPGKIQGCFSEMSVRPKRT